MLKDKRSKLFLYLGGFFIANALMAEFIGVKIFSFEKTLGLAPLNLSLLGYDDLSWNLTAGVLIWPIVFVMTDVINEYFGKKGVRFLSFLAVGLILYAFLIISVAIRLSPADFWPQSHILPDWSENEKNAMLSKVGDFNQAYKLVFGQGLWIIIGSICAFLIGQILDVVVFHRIKKWTGDRAVWLRATGSTLVSQLVDSFVVLFIAFYIGANWDLSLVLAIGFMNYLYKFIVAILLTPLIYFAHFVIDKYLGQDLAEKMKYEAHENQ